MNRERSTSLQTPPYDLPILNPKAKSPGERGHCDSRQVVALREIGWTFEQIANALGVSVGTALKRYFEFTKTEPRRRTMVNCDLWFAKIVNSREMKPMAGAPKGLEFVQDWHHDSPS